MRILCSPCSFQRCEPYTGEYCKSKDVGEATTENRII